jgi:chromosome partitioning protein
VVVAVTNRKGGSGKSSIAVNVAACWATGMRTLLIDLDPQADASAWLGVEDSGEGLADTLVGRAPLADAIHETESGVDLAPAGEALGYVSEGVQRDALVRALASVRDRGYQVVVLDCAPGLDRLAVAAWQAVSDTGGLALVPVDGPKAFRAVARLQHAWEDLGLDATRMRVVVTRHDGRRVLDRELERQARARYGDAVARTVVRESVAVAESAAWRTPLVLRAPGHFVTADVRRLAREVYGG